MTISGQRSYNFIPNGTVQWTILCWTLGHSWYHKASNLSTNHGETEKQKYWFYCCISSVTPGLDQTRSNTQGTVQTVLLNPWNVTPSICTLGIDSPHPENNRLQSCTDVYKDRLNCTLGGWGYERASELLEWGKTQIGTVRRLNQKKEKHFVDSWSLRRQ